MQVSGGEEDEWYRGGGQNSSQNRAPYLTYRREEWKKRKSGEESDLRRH